MKREQRDVLKKRTRNVLSWVFSLALVSTMMPVNALAAVAADNAAAEEAAQVQAEQLDADDANAAAPEGENSLVGGVDLSKTP